MALAARGTPNLQLPPDQLRSIYRTMLRIRRFEEQTATLFAEGSVKGTAHSYIGEEAIAAGVCANLNTDDYIGSYHRGHGHCIAKGASLHMMMAELMGRSTGYCGGLGGSMHIASLELGILGANGIVGAAMPLCTGAALAAKITGNGKIAVAFFGDGAANQGVFHEFVESRIGLEASHCICVREQSLRVDHLVQGDNIDRTNSRSSVLV